MFVSNRSAIETTAVVEDDIRSSEYRKSELLGNVGIDEKFAMDSRGNKWSASLLFNVEEMEEGRKEIRDPLGIIIFVYLRTVPTKAGPGT